MKLFLAIVLLSVTGTVLSQVSTAEGLKVNGVALGDSYRQVVRKLGKPSSERKRKGDECVGGTEMTLRYPGLELRLWDDVDNPKNFTVGWFEVKSAKWSVSGTKVGQTIAAVRKLLGKPATVQTENGLNVWFYDMDEEKGPGNTSLTFRGGKVISISTMWLMC